MRSTRSPKAYKLLLALLLCLALSLPASAHDDEELIGTIPEGWKAFDGVTAQSMIDSTTSCSSFGAAAADAVRLALHTDAAILNGGDFYMNLLPGDVTWASLHRSFTQDRQLGCAQLTPAALYEILEAGLSHITLDEGDRIDRARSSYAGFPQISGFTLRCDYSLPPGQRVVSLTLFDGRSLARDDTQTLLRLGAPVNMLEGDYGLPALAYEPQTVSLFDALAAYIAAGEFEEHAAARIEAIGCTRPWLLGSLSRSAVVIVAVAAVVLILMYEARGKKARELQSRLRWEDGGALR